MKSEKEHKWVRMKFIGLREAGLATYTCPICKNYLQSGTEEEKAYCCGVRQRFEPLRKEKLKDRVAVIPKAAVSKIIESKSLIAIVFKNKEEKERWIR